MFSITFSTLINVPYQTVCQVKRKQSKFSIQYFRCVGVCVSLTLTLYSHMFQVCLNCQHLLLTVHTNAIATRFLFKYGVRLMRKSLSKKLIAFGL